MINEILKDHRPTMSEFQHDHFVTGMSAVTPYGQYKQAVRELYTRVCSLRDLEFEKEEMEIDVDEQEYISKNSEDKFERRRASVKLKRKQMQMFDLLERKKDQQREAMSFYRQSAQLKEMIGELTPEKEKELEAEMWEAQCKKLAALDIINGGGISKPTLEMAFSMKGEVRERLLDTFKKDPVTLLGVIEQDTEVSANLINGKEYPKLDFKKLLEVE